MTEKLKMTNRKRKRAEWRARTYDMIVDFPGSSTRDLEALTGINRQSMRIFLNLLFMAGAVERTEGGYHEFYYTALYPRLSDCETWIQFEALTDKHAEYVLQNNDFQDTVKVERKKRNSGRDYDPYWFIEKSDTEARNAWAWVACQV